MSTRRPSSAIRTHCQPEDLLTLRLVGSAPVSVIEVIGELDMDTTHLLTELAESVLRTQAPLVLVVDLARLRFLCAQGIRALLQVRDAAAARSAHLVLCDPSPITRRVLGVTGTLDVFDIKTGATGT